MAILLSIKSQNGKSSCTKLTVLQLTYLERVKQRVGVSHFDHFCNLLNKFFDSWILSGKSFIKNLQITQLKDFLFWPLFEQFLSFLLLFEIKTVVQGRIVRVWRYLTHQGIQLAGLSFIRVLIVTVRIGIVVPFCKPIYRESVDCQTVCLIVHSSVINVIINSNWDHCWHCLVVVLLSPQLLCQ